MDITGCRVKTEVRVEYSWGVWRGAVGAVSTEEGSGPGEGKGGTKQDKIRLGPTSVFRGTCAPLWPTLAWHLSNRIQLVATALVSIISFSRPVFSCPIRDIYSGVILSYFPAANLATNYVSEVRRS
jgi:hypothetical protein